MAELRNGCRRWDPLWAVAALVACADAHPRDAASPEDDAADGGAPTDAAGELVTGEVDLDCDGTRDHCLVRMYHDQRELVLNAIDEDCDGLPDRACVHLVQDADGVITRSSDEDCDGEPDGDDCSRTRRDSQGNQTFWSRDPVCDGRWQDCRESVYAPDGVLLRETYDGECDGQPDSCVSSTDDGGEPRTIVERTDYACDGAGPMTCRVRRRDGQGRDRGGGRDQDCDGTLDRDCVAIVYDAEGYRYQYDSDCDGVHERCTVHVSSARIRSNGVDADCDGVADSDCGLVTYDAQGNVISEIADDDCDGEPDGFNCEYLAHNEDGTVTAEHDHDCDGTADTCTTWRP